MSDLEKQVVAPKSKPTGEPSAARPQGRSLLRRPVIRYALAGAGILALVLAAIAIFNNRPIKVEVASLDQNVPVRVFGLGTVEARIMSKIGFEVGATLVELNADHGDRVTKDQVIARLSVGEQEAKVAKARAALKIAEVNIQRAEANLEKAHAILATEARSQPAKTGAC